MKVINYLKTDMICLDMKSKDKEGAIRELGEYIKKTGEVKDYDKFVEEVSNRVLGLLLDTIKAECVRLSEQTGKPTDALVNLVKSNIRGMLE